MLNATCYPLALFVSFLNMGQSRPLFGLFLSFVHSKNNYGFINFNNSFKLKKV